MAQVSLRIGKLKTSTLGAAQNHNQREQIPEHVITEQTHLNQILIGGQTLTSDVMNRIRKNSITVTHGKQNESTIAIEIVLSASPKFFRPNSGERGEFDQKKMEMWRDANMEFLKEKFGENLVRLDLHLDESTPHMHAIITPILRQDRKLRRTKNEIKNGVPAKTQTIHVLNASKMFNKKSLIQLQTEAANAVKHLGIERGQQNSQATHTVLKEWYKDQFSRDITSVQVEINNDLIDEQNLELKQLKAEMDRLRPKLIAGNKALVTTIPELERKIAILEAKFSNAKYDLEQTENNILQLKRQTNPHAYVMEQKIKHLERDLKAYKVKFGELGKQNHSNPSMGDLERVNTNLKR